MLPAGLKGARRPLRHVGDDAGHVGCRVVAGYVLGIELGMGVVGVWLGMFLDWAVRGALFYWRMVSGRWLWKYPRVRPRRETYAALGGGGNPVQGVNRLSVTVIILDVYVATAVKAFADRIDALPANVDNVFSRIVFGVYGEFVLLVFRFDILDFLQQHQSLHFRGAVAAL